MFVSIYYKPSLFNAQTIILIFHIFMNVNKFCLNQVLLSSFSHWRVKGSPLKRKVPKTDVIGPEYILFAGAPVHHSAREFYRLGQ